MVSDRIEFVAVANKKKSCILAHFIYLTEVSCLQGGSKYTQQLSVSTSCSTAHAYSKTEITIAGADPNPEP